MRHDLPADALAVLLLASARCPFWCGPLTVHGRTGVRRCACCGSRPTMVVHGSAGWVDLAPGPGIVTIHGLDEHDQPAGEMAGARLVLAHLVGLTNQEIFDLLDADSADLAALFDLALETTKEQLLVIEAVAGHVGWYDPDAEGHPLEDAERERKVARLLGLRRVGGSRVYRCEADEVRRRS
jgi:hypothetical protein